MIVQQGDSVAAVIRFEKTRVLVVMENILDFGPVAMEAF